MRGEVVVFDVETTGLDPERDKIIEIGILRAREDTVLDTYQTLVNPGKSIPESVVALTGITDEQVRRAPSIHQVLSQVSRFIGNAPIVGHRVEFDMAMLLEAEKVPRKNPLIDTYELASVLLPTAPRYNLGSLVQHLGLQELETAHRAGDDVLATWHLYRALWKKLLDLPLVLLREIVEQASTLPWLGNVIFAEALAQRTAGGELVSGTLSFPNAFRPLAELEDKPLRPGDEIQALDVDEAAHHLEPDGRLQEKLPHYEPRQSQVRMLREVAKAFNTREHVMIEAPTGTGKSLAYLIPAALWAMQNKERVVISTHTTHLQDQLLFNDIPLLQGPLGMNFRASDLKGRGNYLCPRRLSTARRRHPTSVEELRVLAKVMVWLHEGGRGTLSELNLRGGAERATWGRMSAQDEGCTTDRCRHQMNGTCPFYQARQRAERAHVLIVNHALLLSDVARCNRVLPDYRYLVLDEGHHLEDAITNGLSEQVDKYGLLRRMADLGDTSKGLLGDLLASTRDLPSEAYGKLRDYVSIVVDAVRQMGDLGRGFFDEMAQSLSRDSNDQDGYFVQVRVTDNIRSRNSWQRVVKRWDVLGEYTQAIAEAMHKLALGLLDLERFRDDIEDYDNLLSSMQAAATQLATMHRLFYEFVEKPQPNTVYWVEISTDIGQVTLKGAPLHVGALMQEHLWSAKEAIVLTSATLRTLGNFHFMRERLSADEVNDISLPSPFDYQNSTLLYLPSDIPEPANRKGYQEMVERGIVELGAATNGRMLCLFTSYSQLRETANAVSPRLALGNIVVYDQASGSSRQVLVDSFKSTEKAVLMGTRSFWEGVDLPGDDLSVVVIVRLPFAVPSEPIFAARSEVYGEAAFREYSVPDAILRFRQGFGRLIRRVTDRGVVVVMDSRVLTKSYGKLFLDSLPRTTLQRGPMSKLPALAKEWLEKGNPAR
ncbi:MAG: DEAD/DEAH box helicase [Anaerolineae bacterium]|nr:DEAD/DEAH box helicase [Anaerolineae bacterium]